MRFDWKLLVLAVFAAGSGCADFHRGPAPPDAAPIDAEATDPVFEKNVYPILQVNCQYCHRAAHEAGRSKLVLTGDAQADRAMVVALVVPGDPATSLLLLRATGEEHYAGEVIMPATPDYKTIADWITSLPPAP